MWKVIEKIIVVVGLIGVVVGFMIANNIEHNLIDVNIWEIIGNIVKPIPVVSFLLWITVAFKSHSS